MYGCRSVVVGVRSEVVEGWDREEGGGRGQRWLRAEVVEGGGMYEIKCHRWNYAPLRDFSHLHYEFFKSNTHELFLMFL